MTGDSPAQKSVQGEAMEADVAQSARAMNAPLMDGCVASSAAEACSQTMKSEFRPLEIDIFSMSQW